MRSGWHLLQTSTEIPFSNPLAGGYLTSRYNREDQGADTTDSRFDKNKWQGRMYRARYFNDEYFDALDLLRPLAKKHGLTEAECALRWMNHHSMLKREHGDAIIIGASSTKASFVEILSIRERSDRVSSTLKRIWSISRKAHCLTRLLKLSTKVGRVAKGSAFDTGSSV